MRKNFVKQALKEGKTVIGTSMAGTRSVEVVRALAKAGFDFLFVDTEHSPFDMQDVSTIVRECRWAGIVPLVRVPDAEYHLIARRLDAGALGLIMPRVETVEQVHRIVQSAKYPPWGIRGCGMRGIMTDYESVPVKEYIREANEETLIAIQIESRQALDELDALLSIEGVDAAFIGPNDLSISIGVPGELDHPLMREGIEKVIEVCGKYGVAPGIHVKDRDLLVRWMEKGIRMATYTSDVGLLTNAATESVGVLRKAIGRD